MVINVLDIDDELDFVKKLLMVDFAEASKDILHTAVKGHNFSRSTTLAV